MATRYGPAVGGTDGSDFFHRETIATHYKESVLFKNRLLKVIYGHFALVVVALVYISLVTDRPWWVFSWLSTAFTCALGVLAVPKNHAGLLTVFALNNLAVGIGSSAFGLYSAATTDRGGAPLVIGCLCALCLHVLELAFSRFLIGSWTAKRTTRS